MLRSFAPSLVAMLWLAPPAPAQQEPISEYTTHVAYPVISSSYDFMPQVATLPSDPSPRLIPVHKSPPVDGRGFAPRVKQYGGFVGIEQTPWSPPDPTLAVGPNHVLETVNMQIAWWTKDGTLQFSQRLDSTGSPGFFEDVGAGDFTFDPKCLYDEASGRFFVLALEVYSSTAYITFAISDDSDPNGTWYKYRTDAKTRVSGFDYWVDYPGLGVDSQAFYVTGNLFGLNTSGFAGTKYRIITKSNILSGGPAVYLDMRDGGSASTQAAHVHGSAIAPMFVSVKDTNEIRVQAIKNPTTSPTLFTNDVTVTSFNSPPSAPTLGGGSVDTLDGRLINAYLRDGFLYCGHGIGKNSKAVARWYEFATGNWPNSGSVSVSQQGNVDLGSGLYSWFPAIARNLNGDIGMVMARSSSSEYPSVWYTRHQQGDPANTMQPALELKAGEAAYSGRWGDYFDIAVDPVSDTKFWGVGEYAKGSGWSTWLGSLSFSTGSVAYIEPGSPGTAGLIPFLEVGVPTIAESLDIHISNSLGGVPFFFVAGTAQGSINLLGAQIHVNFPWWIFGPFTMGGLPLPGFGETDVTALMPNDPGLVGFTLYMQCVINDPGAPLDVAATRAAALTFGE